MKRGAWHDFGGQHPWHSIDQTPPKLSWPNAPGWPPADALHPPEAPKPPVPFGPGVPVTVDDDQDEWHTRDGVIIGQPGDERGVDHTGRWDVDFEGMSDPTQRRVYREDQLRRR